jgi:hypothetical protein
MANGSLAACLPIRQTEPKPADPSVPDFVPRPEWQLVLRPWCDADAVRLGIKPSGQSAPPTPAAPPPGGQKAKSRLQVVGRGEPQAD